jgi:hypothetical protein
MNATQKIKCFNLSQTVSDCNWHLRLLSKYHSEMVDGSL